MTEIMMEIVILVMIQIRTQIMEEGFGRCVVTGGSVSSQYNISNNKEYLRNMPFFAASCFIFADVVF